MNAWTVTSPNGRTVTEHLTPAFLRLLRQEGWTVNAMAGTGGPGVPPSVAEYLALPEAERLARFPVRR